MTSYRKLTVTDCHVIHYTGPVRGNDYKKAPKPPPRVPTIYVISVIMAVLIVAFFSTIVYLKVQHRKSALPQRDRASSGSISKSTQSTLQHPSFDLKQSISEIKSCVFNQVSRDVYFITDCVKSYRALQKRNHKLLKVTNKGSACVISRARGSCLHSAW